MTLLEFADEIVKIASDMHVDDCEVLLNKVKLLKYTLENKNLYPEIQEDILNIGVRILKDGKMGYVPLTETNKEEVKAGIQASLRDLKPSGISEFVQIPSKLRKEEAYDRRIEYLLSEPREFRKVAEAMMERPWKADAGKGRIESLEGEISLSVEERLVSTMHSSKPAHQERTMVSWYVDLNSKDFEFGAIRRAPPLTEIEETGTVVYVALPQEEKSPEKLSVKGKTVDVILEPFCTISLIEVLLSEQIYGTSRLEGLSKYKVGEKVASENVTLMDDGTAPNLEETFPTDDEGTVSRTNLVINKGVFKNFLYDRASAKRDGKRPTGNGKRRPILVESETEAPIRCGLRNIVMEPGNQHLDDMIDSTRMGLLVKSLMGLHTANRTTGDFGHTVHIGKVIENGTITATVEPGKWNLKGNIVALLGNVEGLSKERRRVGSFELPWIKTSLYVS